MKLSAVAISMGLGAAAGAVAVLMMPRSSPARKLADRAADKVEDAAMAVSEKLSNAIDL